MRACPWRPRRRRQQVVRALAAWPRRIQRPTRSGDERRRMQQRSSVGSSVCATSTASAGGGSPCGRVQVAPDDASTSACAAQGLRRRGGVAAGRRAVALRAPRRACPRSTTARVQGQRRAFPLRRTRSNGAGKNTSSNAARAPDATSCRPFARSARVISGLHARKQPNVVPPIAAHRATASSSSNRARFSAGRRSQHGVHDASDRACGRRARAPRRAGCIAVRGHGDVPRRALVAEEREVGRPPRRRARRRAMLRRSAGRGACARWPARGDAREQSGSTLRPVAGARRGASAPRPESANGRSCTTPNRVSVRRRTSAPSSGARPHRGR